MRTRSDEGVCWGAFSPFEKAILAPTIRVNRRESIVALCANRGFKWDDLKALGWRVVRVRVDRIRPKAKRKPR